MRPVEPLAGRDIGTDNKLVVRGHDPSVPLSLGKFYFPLTVTPGDFKSKASARLQNLAVVFAGTCVPVVSAGPNKLRPAHFDRHVSSASNPLLRRVGASARSPST